MRWKFWKRDPFNGADTCDPDARGSALDVLHYYLGFAAHALGDQRVRPYGHCHVVPSLRGLDLEGNWRRPLAFEGATRTSPPAICECRLLTAPTMLALPDVMPGQVVKI